MKKAGEAFDRLLALTGVIPGVIVAALAIGVAAEVFARNIGVTGFYWMLEAVEYGLLTLTMVGAAYVLSIGRHVTVDLVLNALPGRLRRQFRIGIDAVIVAVALIIVYYGIVTAHLAYVEDSTLFKSFDIKEWIPAAVVPVGMSLFAVEAIRQLVISIRRRNDETDEDGREKSEVF
jgi:TRAP-type C4-dicarboxylate transport system permease small subunit